MEGVEMRKVYTLQYKSRDGVWDDYRGGYRDADGIRKTWRELDHDLEWRLRVYEISPERTVPKGRFVRHSKHEFPWSI
jgi:hypothetical protein